MELKAETIYTMPIAVNPMLNHNEQISQTLKYAADTISRIDPESLKAALIKNLKVVYPT